MHERGRICYSQMQPRFLVTTFPPRAVNHSDFTVVKTGSASPGKGGKLVTRGRRDVDLESGRALVRVCVCVLSAFAKQHRWTFCFIFVADGENFSSCLQFEETGRSLVVSNGSACWPCVQQKACSALNYTTAVGLFPPSC